MFNSISGRQAMLIAATAILCAAGTSACGNSHDVKPTRQGTISLDSLKVGMPETNFKDAVLTFVPDPNGSVGGKTQYLSRTYNADGGQFIAQCRDGQCYEVQVYFAQAPIAKDNALKNLKSLLPEDAPPQSKVDDAQLKAPKADGAVETYYFGNTYKGELVYTDKTGSQVKSVNVYQEKPQQAASTPATNPASTTTSAQ